MKNSKFNLIFLFVLIAISACNKSEQGHSAVISSSEKAIDFVTTQDGKSLKIAETLFNTPAAKEFLHTSKNPYIGNAEAIAKGKKIFQLYSCTQCHGPEAKGQVGPGLTGPDYRYPKDATNKGMFETVWHGTNGGMGAKGVGLMDPTDPNNGISPDDLLKVIAWIRSLSNITGNE